MRYLSFSGKVFVHESAHPILSRDIKKAAGEPAASAHLNLTINLNYQ
jgi:hypothetical protein